MPKQKSPSCLAAAKRAGVLCIAALLGCQPTASQPKPVTENFINATGDVGPMTPDQVVSSDPCAMQLHDIEGALLTYFAVYKRLPPTLDDLRTMADIDTPLNFICPSTGKPYAYVPNGLGALNDPKHIIVYDSAPHANGKRWCILMSPPTGIGPNAAQAMEVLPIPDSKFKMYMPMD